MRATTEGAEIPRSGNSLPRRAIALGHSPRPCAGSRKHRRPRLSMVENRSRRAPTPICVQRPTGPKSRGPVTARPVAPSFSATLPDRAPARARTADRRLYRWSKIGLVEQPAHQRCTQAPGVTGSPRSGNSLRDQMWTATRTFAVTCGRSRVPTGTWSLFLRLEPQRTVPPDLRRRRSMPASGTRHVRGPLPSPIRPSKRPLPIHSTRCATASMWHLPASPLESDAQAASCRTVPSAQADGPMPASGPRHARGPLPSPIRPSKRPLPIRQHPLCLLQLVSRPP